MPEYPGEFSLTCGGIGDIPEFSAIGRLNIDFFGYIWVDVLLPTATMEEIHDWPFWGTLSATVTVVSDGSPDPQLVRAGYFPFVGPDRVIEGLLHGGYIAPPFFGTSASIVGPTNLEITIQPGASVIQTWQIPCTVGGGIPLTLTSP